MQERIAVADRVDVHEQDGGFAADWASVDGKISFTARSGSREAVAAAVLALRDAYAGLADCRRRCEKGGLSPAGAIDTELQLLRGGKTTAKIGSSTVAHKRALPCTERVLRGLRLENAPAGQRVQVEVKFSG